MKIDIIVPVYDGYDDTVRCIESVLNSDLMDQVYVNVINDKSPNDELTDWLRCMAKSENMTLFENEENMGFVETANRGMRLHEDRDVVLLNSDTVVANDWVDRICAHARRDQHIATITPFSNNATICSFPNICEENSLFSLSIDSIDRAFSKANAGKSEFIPTAVGFCMYIRRDCMSEIGFFDVAKFGRGYGEENDFCMRAVKAGWKHIMAADIFVAHVGGVSFSHEKTSRMQDAQQVIDRLYPNYNEIVQDFIAKDPLVLYRMQAHAELIRMSARKTVLLVSHNRGGGVEKCVREFAAYYESEVFFPIVRQGNTRGEISFALSPFSKDKISFCLPSDYGDLLSVCREIGVGRVDVHHTMGLDASIFTLAQDLGCEMTYMVHDYYMVNGNPTLTAKDGKFCDNHETRDDLCTEVCPLPDGVSVEEWRKKHQVFLDECSNVYAPSQYALDLFCDYFALANKRVLYHLDSVITGYPQPMLPHPSNEDIIKVLVVGAIGKEKGADILEETAVLANKRGDRFQFHLLGYAYRPLDAVVEHGSYSDDDIDSKIEGIAPDILWYPALCPETYSYTLSAGLRSRRPIVASSLGAFSERLKGRLYSGIGNWKNSPAEWIGFFYDFIDKMNGWNGEENGVWCDIYGDSREQYDFFWTNVKKQSFVDGGVPSFADLRLSRDIQSLNRKEEVLVFLVKLRSQWFVRRLIRFIPVSIQKKIKRFLSKRPIHELTFGRNG